MSCLDFGFGKAACGFQETRKVVPTPLGLSFKGVLVSDFGQDNKKGVKTYDCLRSFRTVPGCCGK